MTLSQNIIQIKQKQLNATPNNEINPKQDLCSQKCNKNDYDDQLITKNPKRSLKSLHLPPSSYPTDNFASPSSTTHLLTYTRKNGNELDPPTESCNCISEISNQLSNIKINDQITTNSDKNAY